MYDGYLLARKHKRYQDCVLEYTNLLEDNLIDAVNRLQWHEYQTGPLHQFYEYYPKKRIISSLPFYDRVVNCAAYNVTWPIYSKSFYEHSYGSVPGKGPVRCANTIQGWMREAAAKPGDWYFVKMDITKFFFRIPTEVQLRELGRPLDDADMMWFFERAIRCDGRPLGLPLHCTDVTTAERIAGRGMQVGSLVSQMTANVVMTPADHYIKRELCAPYYARYMDDGYAIHEDIDFLRTEGMFGLEEMTRKLGLRLNWKKTRVIPLADFYRWLKTKFILTPSGKVILKMNPDSTKIIRRKLRTFHGKWERGEMTVADIRSSVESYHGHMKRGNSFKVRENTNQYFKSMFGFYPNKKGWERNVSNSQRWNASGNGDNPCVGQNAEQRVLRPMHRGTGTRHCDRGVCVPH